MLLAHLPFYLKDETPLEQAQAIKHMDKVMIPPIVRMKNLMMQGPTDPLNVLHYQGTILESLSIILVYPSGSRHIGKHSMEEYLIAVNPALWTTVNRGITFPSGDATLTQEQSNEIQRNYQAIRIIKSSLTSEEYDKEDGLKSSKEVWDTLFINHEGTNHVKEERIRALESEHNRFVNKDDESPQDMYNRLNKIINKIKSLGSTRWEEEKWLIRSSPHTWQGMFNSQHSLERREASTSSLRRM
jgi:hypothetical protein